MTKQNKCLPIVMFLIFLTVGISKAEPTPTVSYLMNTPVSMLDFGIYKLENFLNEESGKLMVGKTEPKINVSYDYDSNRILIWFVCDMKEDFYKSHDIKQEITILIRDLKESYFGYDHNTGKPTELRKMGGTVINQFFSHEGYVLKNQPKNFVEELEKITEIQVNAFVTGLAGTMIIGKSPLIGNTIYWSK